MYDKEQATLLTWHKCTVNGDENLNYILCKHIKMKNSNNSALGIIIFTLNVF